MWCPELHDGTQTLAVVSDELLCLAWRLEAVYDTETGQPLALLTHLESTAGYGGAVFGVRELGHMLNGDGLAELRTFFITCRAELQGVARREEFSRAPIDPGTPPAQAYAAEGLHLAETQAYAGNEDNRKG